MKLLCEILGLAPAGFEPALPKETDLESVALDHSAIDPVCLRDTICLNYNTDEFAVDVSNKPPAGLEPATLRLKV